MKLRTVALIGYGLAGLFIFGTIANAQLANSNIPALPHLWILSRKATIMPVV
jgi:hypothetical protein